MSSVFRTLALGLGLVGFLSTLATAAPARPRTWWWYRTNGVAVSFVDGTAPAAANSTAAPSFAGPVDTSGIVSNMPVASSPIFYSNMAASASRQLDGPARSPRPSTSYPYDAYLNMGDGAYAGASTLTSGGAQPWYLSPVVSQLYGGVPNADERAAFSQGVLDRVEQTYAKSGITLSLTTNPLDSAAHSLSVVSNTSYAANPDAVGITNLGGDGFSFIDKLSYAKSVDELEWAVAHNVSHELMHAFGAGHHDTTGNYLDGAVSNWTLLTDPNATLGPDAVADLLSKELNVRSTAAILNGAQMIAPAPVPEPTTVALWGLAGAAAILVHRRRRAAKAAC